MKIEIWHNIMWSRYKAGVFSELHRQLAQKGHELFVYQIAETESDRMNLSSVDKTVHRYPYLNLFSGSYSSIPMYILLKKVIYFTYNSKADLTILAGYDRLEFWAQLCILILMKRQRAVFCDSTAYDNRQTFWKSLAKRFFFSNVHAALCYGNRSAAYAKSYGAKLVIPRCQAAALPSEYVAEDIAAKRVEHQPLGGPVFIYVGRLSSEKQINTLLRAFQEVRAEVSTAKLRIVGKGPQEDELVALTHSLGLTDSAVFVGSKAGGDLTNEYLSATCLILPSKSEPWGLVVNEALHYGCPVLVSNRCGCIPELVEGSDCGLEFVCEDVEDLAAKMIAAITLFSDRARIATRCLERIAPFTPLAAAIEIVDGVENLAQSTRE